MLVLRRRWARRRRRKAPEALIKEVSTDVLDAVKADKTIQAGDIRKVIALVDQKVLPYVNFQRMTASAVGRYWRSSRPAETRARGGTRTGFQPLNFRHSPANLANPAQSGTGTTRSEAQGVHIVHTLSFPGSATAGLP